MKIYFGASITLDRKHLPVYQQIVRDLKDMGHTVLSEYVVDPDLKVGDGLTAEQLYQRETSTVDQADVMIAEVSSPSWGTAFLMEHALKSNIPVLALFYKDVEHQLPLMIQGHQAYFVEHYNSENLTAVLKRNLKYFEQLKKRTGKLIVIDGADGAGKATQTELLLKYMKTKRISSQFISFPRYYTSFHGKHVGRFLKGEFGGNSEVSPYLSSLAFALDRLTAKDEMNEWLDQGNVVIADRYVSASMAHQASKLPAEKRDSFIEWVYDMEYKVHKLPRENIVIFLYVPAEVSQKLLADKSGKDLAEKDVEHQRNSIKMYEYLVNKFPHWHMVKCVNAQGELLSREDIHQKIVTLLKEQKILPKE